MNYKLLRRLCFLVLLLLLGLLNISPVQAGEPDNTIGPANPAMFWCVDRDDPYVIINLDSDVPAAALDALGKITAVTRVKLVSF